MLEQVAMFIKYANSNHSRKIETSTLLFEYQNSFHVMTFMVKVAIDFQTS